ncbi:ABC transporter ATP-binding protein [Tranquillimonas alkanivorans]|uniref:ATP-binding cassette, subfamily B, multidrug efflux pump n=1 Tax=Tranquillimonas alkanivorans TaxID=441119 RepID=A0A1I5Q927_9RHOB|nr:ABC transporter ATP-binding protein [Tranquillimonas alkanivorans]SFP42560.1 ATP-binding cassette, subfamily B, multidrug efflux pump [Tranquillimonas alkanivorans]
MFRLFENLVDPFLPREPSVPPSDLLRYLRAQIRPYRRWLPWMGAAGFLKAAVECGLIFYGGRLIDLMAAEGPADFWAAHAVEVTVVALLVLLVRPLVIGLNHLFLDQTLSSNIQEQVRWQSHRHLLGQAPAYFQNDFSGRLTNRVMQMGKAVEEMFYSGFEAIWFALVYVVSATLILSEIDLRLGLPLAAWLVLYILYVRRMVVRITEASETWSDARSDVTGRVVDAYSNIETVKLFSHGESEAQYALSGMRRVRERAQRFRRLMTELGLGMNALNGLMILGVVGPAVWLWTQGTATLGQVSAACALTIRLNGMTGWIMWVATRLFENAGIVREGLRSVSVPHTVTDRARAPALRVASGAISFENLHHRYGKARGGLEHVDLKVPGGQRVGLVGRSGAGKSTLVNLLLRFRDPEGGCIRIDGQRVDEVTQESLRRNIGVVTQDPSLLNRSIRDNLLYGRPEATEAEMIAAAKRAEAHDFILGLRDVKGRTGYDTVVGERGVTLSGGQRQRIAIARVILKGAPILVLDEATSALDSEVEAAILETLYEVMEGKTVIAIAHRLSTIARMNRIVVLDEGRVVEDGPHGELLAKGGLYARLWERQSGGFIADGAATETA